MNCSFVAKTFSVSSIIIVLFGYEYNDVCVYESFWFFLIEYYYDDRVPLLNKIDGLKWLINRSIKFNSWNFFLYSHWSSIRTESCWKYGHYITVVDIDRYKSLNQIQNVVLIVTIDFDSKKGLLFPTINDAVADLIEWWIISSYCLWCVDFFHYMI